MANVFSLIEDLPVDIASSTPRSLPIILELKLTRCYQFVRAGAHRPRPQGGETKAV